MESIDSSVDELRSLETQINPVLPFDLIVRPDSKTAKLAQLEPPEGGLKARNRWHRYEFSEEVFVFNVVVETKDYFSSAKFDFYWVGSDGERREKTLSKRDDETFWAIVNERCREVGFLPPKTYFSKPEIGRVVLSGCR